MRVINSMNTYILLILRGAYREELPPYCGHRLRRRCGRGTIPGDRIPPPGCARDDRLALYVRKLGYHQLVPDRRGGTGDDRLPPGECDSLPRGEREPRAPDRDVRERLPQNRGRYLHRRPQPLRRRYRLAGYQDAPGAPDLRRDDDGVSLSGFLRCSLGSIISASSPGPEPSVSAHSLRQPSSSASPSSPSGPAAAHPRSPSRGSR